MRPLFCALLVWQVALVPLWAGGRHVSKSGKFAVVFPPGSKAKIDENDSFEIYGVVHEDLILTVMSIKPPPRSGTASSKSLFDEWEKNFLQTSKGKLITSRDFHFGPKKLPAREILVETDGDFLRRQMIVTPTRDYTILAGGPSSLVNGKAAEAFFKSFELLD